MSAIPYVHRRRHYTVPDLNGNFQQDDRGTEMALFKAESASEIMASFYATIVNGTPTIDANWIATHAAGLRDPKNSGQTETSTPATSNPTAALSSPALVVTHLA